MKKKEKSYNFVLGIDIGNATRMGVALMNMETKELVFHKRISRKNSKTNLEHRYNLVNCIKDLLKTYPIDILIFENIRLFSAGRIQLQTILSLNKVQTTLINEFSDEFDIYGIDVRTWKSRVLGNGNADKMASINHVQHKFPNVNLIDEIIMPKKKITLFELDADLADAICISEVLKFGYDCLQDKNKMNYK